MSTISERIFEPILILILGIWIGSVLERYLQSIRVRNFMKLNMKKFYDIPPISSVTFPNLTIMRKKLPEPPRNSKLWQNIN